MLIFFETDVVNNSKKFTFELIGHNEILVGRTASRKREMWIVLWTLAWNFNDYLWWEKVEGATSAINKTAMNLTFFAQINPKILSNGKD